MLTMPNTYYTPQAPTPYRTPTPFRDFSAPATTPTAAPVRMVMPPVNSTQAEIDDMGRGIYGPPNYGPWAAMRAMQNWQRGSQTAADAYTNAYNAMRAQYQQAANAAQQAGIPMPGFAPTAPQVQRTTAGSNYANAAPALDIPQGVDETWYRQFMAEHPYTIKSGPNAGKTINLTPEQVYSRDGDYAIAHALADRAWGDQFQRTYGRPPTEDDWKYSYADRQRAFYQNR